MEPTERGELEALRDTFAAAPEGAGAHSREVAGALCIRLESLPSAPEFNRAMGLGLDEPATEEALDEVVSFLAGTASLVTVAPAASELEGLLAARGFVRGYGWTKFSRGVDDPPEPETSLRVELDEQGDAFADAAVRGYGVPADPFEPWLAALAGRDGWHCFVAWDGDEPAGAGALFVTGDVGWLGVGATVPEHRRKGAQSAVLAARIRAAARAGCTVVTTETGEPREGVPGPSWRNIARAGFEPRYVRANWIPG